MKISKYLILLVIVLFQTSTLMAEDWSDPAIIIPIPSSWTVSSAANPQLAIDSTGRVFAIWYSDVDDGGGSKKRILSSIYSSGQWSEASIIPVPGSWTLLDITTQPQLAIDSNDNVHAIWQIFDTDDLGVKFRIASSIYSNLGGWSLAEKIPPPSGSPVQFARPQLAIDSTNKVFAVWGYDSGGNTEIASSIYSSGSWSSEATMIPSPPGTTIRIKPQIKIDLTDKVYLICSATISGNKAMVSSIYSSGSWSSETIPPPAGTETVTDDPQLAIDSNNNVYAAWESTVDGQKEVVSSIYSSGSWPSEATIIPPPPGTVSSTNRPNIALDSNNNVYVAWESTIDGQKEIISSVYNSGSWSSEAIIIPVPSSWTISTAARVGLAIDATDKIYALWDANIDGQIEIANSIYSSGSWSESTIVPPPTGTVTSTKRPQPAISTDKVYVIWESVVDGNDQIVSSIKALQTLVLSGSQYKVQSLYESDLINLLSWQAIGGALYYNIYLDLNKTNLLARVNNQTSFIHHNRTRNEQTTYYVTYVDAGGESTPISITVP
ncbi:MAG: hypothetical protein K940chlam5_01084 [Candidatus Anoxychlamydiales bacterium]|nr:hypothetical protein [Candidatus Anoxychlamydiales bacterium]